MSKTRKQIFAEYLNSHKRGVTAEGVMRLSQSENLGIQVKTLGSEGDFVIKFSERDTFIKPSEWLHNYQVSAKERYEEARSVYQSADPQGLLSDPGPVGTPTNQPVQASFASAKQSAVMEKTLRSLHINWYGSGSGKPTLQDDGEVRAKIKQLVPRCRNMKQQQTLVYLAGEIMLDSVEIPQELVNFISTEKESTVSSGKSI